MFISIKYNPPDEWANFTYSYRKRQNHKFDKISRHKLPPVISTFVGFTVYLQISGTDSVFMNFCLFRFNFEILKWKS